MEIFFKRTHNRFKKCYHMENNVFALYVPKATDIEPATTCNIDTGIILYLPDRSHGFVTSMFRRDEIHKLKAKKQRLEISNKSHLDNLIIKKDSVLGFVVIEPKHLTYKHETKKIKKEKEKQAKKRRQTKAENANVNTKVS